MKKIIVLARVEMTGTRPTGNMVKRDLNWYPEVKPAPEAKALVYSSDITELDKAQAFAKQEGWYCWEMPDSNNLLQIARDRALHTFLHNEGKH